MPDMPGMPEMEKDIPHKFPYGVWTANGIDRNGTSLPCDLPFERNGMPGAYWVDVQETPSLESSRAVTDPSEIFQAALKRAPFTYLQDAAHADGVGGDVKITLDDSDINLRVVSVPLPASITPGAFRMKSFTKDQSANGTVPCAHLGTYNRDCGIPTTQIFDYPGANELIFHSPAGPIVVQASDDYRADFHFHVLPIDAAGFDHGQAMFANLMTLVGSRSCRFHGTDLVFMPGDDLEEVWRGALVPPSVADNELEIGKKTASTGHAGTRTDMASCGGGSAAVDGNPRR